MTIAGILLAAGASRRLGTPKQLVAWQGETLLHRSVRMALSAGLRPLRVVLGAELAQCREAIRDQGVEIIENPAWAEGMSTSLRAGLEGLSEEVEAVVVLVCDQPSLSDRHLERLLAVHAAHPEAVVASSYASTLGIPALFPRAHWARLRQLQGDKGARALLREGDVLQVPLSGGEFDLDTPEDLADLSR